jgi:DNA processing protein
VSSTRAAWLALAVAATDGTGQWIAAIAKAGGPEALLASRDDEQENFGLRDAARRRLRKVGGIARGEQLLEEAEKLGLRVSVFGDADYPTLLGSIADPPLALYFRGLPPSACEPVVSIVGAREPSDYGHRMAASLAEALAERGVCVASGLARGIDRSAHEGALRAGKTMAVLPGGVDRVYPASHRALAQRIASSGSLVGERIPGLRPAPYDFPRRNRIVTGVASVTIVIAARRASGTWTSAMHALTQGRHLLALPGNIDEPTSEGPNALIEQGCPPLLSIDDVLPYVEMSGAALGDSKAGPDEPLGAQCLTGNLSPDEQTLLATLGPTPISVEMLCDAASLDGGRIMALLTSLELAGLVEKSPQGGYRAALQGDRNPWTPQPSPRSGTKKN